MGPWNVFDVLHLSKGYPPTPGGIENATHMFAKLSAELGLNTKVLCYGTSNSTKHFKGITISEFRPLFKIMGQPISFRFLIIAGYQMLGVKTIHVHVPDYVSLVLMIIVSCLNPRKKLILHWHSDVIGKGFFQWLLRPLEILALKRCSQVIFGSPDYFETSYAKEYCKNKFEIIPYTSDKQFGELIFCSKPDMRCISLVSVGRLVDYKGYKQLIESFPNQPRLKLTVIGAGPLSDRLTDLVVQLGLQDRVKLIGAVDDRELAQVFTSSDFFILNSQNRAESYGIVLVEALMSGLRILTRYVNGSGMNFINSNPKFGMIYENENKIQMSAEQLLSQHIEPSEVISYAYDRFGFEEFTNKCRKLYKV